MTDELVTPVGVQDRQLLAANPSGLPGAPIVIFHGIADETGRKLGGALALLVQQTAALPTGTNVIGSASIVDESGRKLGGALALTVAQAGSLGADFSANSAAIAGSPLLTIPATPGRLFLEVQNQSLNQLQLVRDDGAGNNQTSIILTGATLAGGQGAGWTTSTFKGRVRVYGPTGSQVAAYQD